MGKVALFIPDYKGGGAERVFVNLANELHTRGHTVDILTVSEHGVFKDDVLTGVRRHSFDKGKVLASLPKLVYRLLNERYDVIYTAMDHVNFAGFIAVRFLQVFGIKIKQVSTVHTNISNVLDNMSGIKKIVYLKVISLLYKNVDNLVCVSKGCRDNLAEQLSINIADIDVIYNPVVKPEIIEKMLSTGHGKKDNDIFHIVSIGRLESVKDYPTALHAISRLVHENNVKVKYTILGEGSQRKSLESEVDRLNIKHVVCFKGFVTNPLSYLIESDLFVLSSTYEGFGNVLVEATEAKIPIISSKCKTGPLEIINNNTCFFQPNCSDSMYFKLVEFVSTDRDNSFINEKRPEFNFDNVIDKYERYIISE